VDRLLETLLVNNAIKSDRKTHNDRKVRRDIIRLFFFLFSFVYFMHFS